MQGVQEEPSPDVPAGQLAQLVSELVVHDAVVSSPEPQVMHGSQEGRPASLWKLVPRAHSSHASAEPVLKRPAGHSSAPRRFNVDFIPGPAMEQTVLPGPVENSPAPLQSLQESEPPNEAFPAGQTSHSVSLIVVQLVVTNLPRPQAVHVVHEDWPDEV